MDSKQPWSSSGAPPGKGAPVVNRRIPAVAPSRAVHSSARSTPTPTRLRPSVRQSIESMGSQAEYFRPEQTIILFDWDDTLCPSNWIREVRPALSFFRPAPNEERYQRPLRELQHNVEQLLRSAMTMGKVVIVTNAMDPWVTTSCRNFLPALVPIVSRLPVIYARSIFDTQSCDRPSSKASNGLALPGLYNANGQNRLTSGRLSLQQQQQPDELAPQRWKEVAFEQEITGFYSRYARQSWKNVLSIGDSVFERDAVRRVVVNRPTIEKKCRTKTVKLLDEPRIDELISQVSVVHDALGMMVQYDGNLDIEIDEDDLVCDTALAEQLVT